MAENYITCQEERGSIHISEDVIVTLVRSTVSEIEGVSGLSNAAGAELAELIGIKTVSKGVKVAFEDGTIVIDVIINVSYGSSIVAVAREVQEKLLSTVQSVTGFEKAKVNVHVAGISFEK